MNLAVANDSISSLTHTIPNLLSISLFDFDLIWIKAYFIAYSIKFVCHTPLFSNNDLLQKDCFS